MFVPMYKNGRALSFGKHKGEKIERVISTDPEYIVWCLDHIEAFDLDNELYSLLENELRAAEHKRNSEYWNALREGQRRRNAPAVSTPIADYVEQESRMRRALSEFYAVDTLNAVTIPSNTGSSPIVEETFDSGIREFARMYLGEWDWSNAVLNTDEEE